MTADIAIIGGSGLYAMEGVTDLQEVQITTPFGAPSDAVMIGRLDGVPVAFLPRHGRGHRVAPHEINYRANIWALKSLGVRWCLSVSAVGSMRESIAPGHLVIVDQFIDRTRTRPNTFFEDGVVGHVGFSDPVCEVLRGAIVRAAQELKLGHQDGGTYVCIEGPQFSTRAESNLYRSWDVDVVGMTNLPEVRLAREAQMAYATIAMATDYDCWHESEEAVTVAAVVATLKANVAKAQRLIRATVASIGELPVSEAFSALENAVMTHEGGVTESAMRRVELLLQDTEYHQGGAP